MANKKITQLPNATLPLAGTEEVEIVQSGTNKRVAVSEFGGGGGSVNSVTGTLVDNTDPDNPVIDVPPLQEVITAGGTFTKTVGDFTYEINVFESGGFDLYIVNNVTSDETTYSFADGNISHELLEATLGDGVLDQSNTFQKLWRITSAFGRNFVKFPKKTSGSGDSNFEIPNNLPAGTYILATEDYVDDGLDLKQDKVTGVSDTEIGYLDGVTSSIQTQIDNHTVKSLLKDNSFWYTPFAIFNASSFGFSSNSIGQTFVLAGNAAGTKGMTLFATTSTAGTIASKRRNDAWQFQGLEFKLTQKIQFQTNISGQRFFCGLTKGNQFSAPTNADQTALTDIVGVAQLSTSTNMHVIHNDASGTATTIDLGSSYPCNDPQYDYFITIEQTTTTYIVTVERVTVATGASISTSNTLSTNIPVYNTGAIQICSWISNNATASIASYLDGGGYGTFKN